MDPNIQSSIGVGHTCKMKVTSVNSASNFGVQLMNRSGTIDLIQENCKRCGPLAGPLQMKDLHEGKLCLARFEADNNWYRAFIREVNEDEGLATVYFADYGNIDDCNIKDDLRECPLSLLKIFPQVIECQWVNANPSGTGMQNIISKLDDLLEAETYVDGTVVRIVDNQGWLLNQAGGDGPVVLSIPELEGNGSKVQVNNKQTAVTVAKAPVANGIGIKPEVGKEKSVLMNGTSVGFQVVDGVDGHGGQGRRSRQILTSNTAGPAENHSSTSSVPGVLLAAVDALTREFGVLRQQILELEKNPAVRRMTPAESAARVQECKAECAQCDEKTNSLFGHLSAKESALQKADEDFINETKQLGTAIRAKLEELVKLRAQAKLHCA